ncbi:MAG TPA: hypothetical protein VIX80_07635 [Candidatus Kapabacteria bacterium]
MKNILLGLAVILLFVGCSEDTPTSSSCTGIVTNDHSTSFKLNGILFDLEQVGNSGTKIYERDFDGTIKYEIISVSYSASGPTAYTSLKLHWKGVTTGTYSWGNKSIDSNSYGCTIIIDSLEVGKRSIYRSVSGQTSIKAYTNLDSLFGRFCGQVKDSLGNVAELSDGRFYIAND